MFVPQNDSMNNQKMPNIGTILWVTVYKPAHVLSLSLASPVLYLHSNLVSSLGLPVWLKPHKLLVTRSPSKKTSLDLSLDLGLTNLSSACHYPRSTDSNSTCPCTTLECALLEIWLCSLCNTYDWHLNSSKYYEWRFESSYPSDIIKQSQSPMHQWRWWAMSHRRQGLVVAKYPCLFLQSNSSRMKTKNKQFTLNWLSI